MSKKKYQETDGKNVYTKIQSWAQHLKEEYKMRKWADVSELENNVDEN